MEWWHALVLGIVEGITEFLPVSSTAHLLVAERLFGLHHTDETSAFAITIQGGAILAVLVLYWNRIQGILLGFLGRDPAGFRLGVNILWAFLPAGVLGVLLEKLIKHYLFAGDAWGLWPIIAAWFVGGVAILIVSVILRRRTTVDNRGRSDLGDLAWSTAFIIGLCQCLAMWPGTSRSLVTIVAGLLVGLRTRAAVEFSFLLGVLTLSAATAKDAVQHGSGMLSEFGPLSLALGFVAAWISAMIAVKWMVGYLNKHGMELFGYYRIGIAFIVAVLVLSDIL